MLDLTKWRSMAEPSGRRGVPSPDKAHVPALVKASAVLDVLAASDRPLRFIDLAESVDIPRSSLHNICSTLVETGLAHRTPEGTYTVGVRVVELARAWLRSSDVVRAFQEACRRQGGDRTVVLSVLTDLETIPVAVSETIERVGMRYEVGAKVPAVFSATGKAMLATYDEAEVRRLVPARSLNPFVREQRKTQKQFLAELDESRARQLATSYGELARGVTCVAAPVFASTRREAVAAVSACFVQSVDASESEYAQVVSRVAAETSRVLGSMVAWAG
jgi:DNA-binding IclR family transcriptional regulator